MKRILVALDNSPRAPEVLAAAASLARMAGAKLVLYRAMTVPMDFPRELLEMTDAGLEDVVRANAHRDLDLLASRVERELVERIMAELATPWDGICRAARDADVDLVVLGSHGHSRIDRMLGTTATKVVNHCDRNVFLVRGAP